MKLARDRPSLVGAPLKLVGAPPKLVGAPSKLVDVPARLGDPRERHEGSWAGPRKRPERSASRPWHTERRDRVALPRVPAGPSLASAHRLLLDLADEGPTAAEHIAGRQHGPALRPALRRSAPRRRDDDESLRVGALAGGRLAPRCPVPARRGLRAARRHARAATSRRVRALARILGRRGDGPWRRAGRASRFDRARASARRGPDEAGTRAPCRSPPSSCRSP